jgi:hypothetical protein
MMDSDLLLAILSIDAYNRGYGEHQSGLPASGALGEFNIIADSSILRDENGNRLDTAAGFYAIAYEWEGRKYISYRGTNPDTIGNFLDDAINGFGLGAGSPYGAQAQLALEFYQRIAGEGVDPFTAPIITTGHSNYGASLLNALNSPFLRPVWCI